MARERSADDMPSDGSREERAPVLQWIGFFLAPAVFFVHLQVGYVLIPWACSRRAAFVVHATGLTAVIIAALGATAAWRVWNRAGREPPGEAGGALPRTRFLGATGLGASAIFTLILFAQWIAGYYVSVCQ